MVRCFPRESDTAATCTFLGVANSNLSAQVVVDVGDALTVVCNDGFLLFDMGMDDYIQTIACREGGELSGLRCVARRNKAQETPEKTEKQCLNDADLAYTKCKDEKSHEGGKCKFDPSVTSKEGGCRRIKNKHCAKERDAAEESCYN